MQVFRWVIFYYLIWSCIFIIFVFLEEIDIKVEENYIFSFFLIEMGYETLIMLTSSG